MAVTVTETETDASFIEKRTNKRHPSARSFSVDAEGRLFLFDHAPHSASESRASLGHTVAIYAPGRWVKAVRS